MKKDILNLIEKKDFVGAEQLISALPKSPLWQQPAYLAALEVARGNFAEAVPLTRVAVELGEDEWLPNLLQAKLLVKSGNGIKALPFAKKAFEVSNGRIDTALFYIHTLLDNAKVQEVVDLCRRIKPKYLESKQILLALGSAYRSLRDYPKARQYIEKLKAIDPDLPTTLRLEADIEADLDSQRGIQLYRHALTRQKARFGKFDEATMWNSSLHFLRTRQFEEGWRYWESGLSAVVGTMGRRLPPQIAELPRVSGPLDDSNSWVLVVPEQGIGDQVLFLSGFREVAEKKLNKLLCADQRMLAILKRSFPDVVVCPPGIMSDWGKNSLPKQGILPYGSILPALRPSLASFPKPSAYLVPNQKRVNDIRRQLRAYAGNRKIIGVSWVGGYWESQKRNKGIDLGEFRALDSKKFLLVSLQYGDVGNDIKEARSVGIDIKIFEGVDFKVNLDEWLSISVAVDEIISVSTALVHFAGASGQRVKVLMPEPQGPWILGIDDTQHLVYQNVRIFRKNPQERLCDLIYRACQS